ncbi:hypothetical protein Cgig2_004332 [Carnegiea gigantea]|uniref:Uncharacterized protein n=1 Tax=Carnegiea gigantea TaxID=171969 RepID=A0A9Q1Q9V0_9CARY|nr:hypothetical protein Cgig2_004332 [Carnegiea gigantea]
MTDNILRANHLMLHFLRRNGVKTLENGSSHYSITVNAVTTTPARATTRHLQQVQERPQGNASIPRSNRQMFIAHGMLARGHRRKLHELYASKSHNPSFVERGANNKVYVESSAIIGKSTDGSLMRYSSIRNVLCNDDVEVCHEHNLEHMHALWTN